MTETNKQMNFLATHDPLTECPNRQLLNDRFRQALAHAKRYQHIFVYALIDLDNFSHVNNDLGTAQADTILRTTARRMTKSVRETDTVGRLKSDNFGMVLSRITSPENAKKVAKTALDIISMPLLLDDKNITVTASIGIAIYPQHGESIEALQAKAEEALQVAKDRGGNCFHIAE